jgi:hypothetical protein
MKNLKLTVILFLSLIIAVSCSVSYSFTGASISPLVKTYSIYDFPNRARLVNPTLSDYFIEELRTKFNRQTSLDYARTGGDLEFEGNITAYDIMPISVQSDEDASENRLTIRMSVKFTNNSDPDQDFDAEFSAYSDFDSDLLISDVEDTLIEEIIEQIIDDIFNKSVANW